MREPASESRPGAATAAVRLLAASSNPGKLKEYRELAQANSPAIPLDLQLLPDLGKLPSYEETAKTFAENAAGKALHYSRFAELPVLADDSGLEVAALDGAPGVFSARYAGPGASDAQRNEKLLHELDARGATDRHARFVCVLALAHKGRLVAAISAAVDGEILRAPRGSDGFGYDPLFFVPELQRSFAQMSPQEKNRLSHRGKAFRKLLDFLVRSRVL